MRTAVAFGLVVASALSLCASVDAQPSAEAARCAAYIEEHPREVHTNSDCLLAAEQGNSAVQYAVGMSFGFAGDRRREAQWYLRASTGGLTDAYLAMGHVMRSEPFNNVEQAVFWYTRYWDADGVQKGYAAELLRQIETDRGNNEQAERWLRQCKQTAYQGCGEGQTQKSGLRPPDVPAA